jgi:excisionase family DNA binding protein
MQGHIQSLAHALVVALDDAALYELALRLRRHLGDSTGRLLDAREAASRLRLHPETVSRMARTGRIAGVKVGREWRFHSDCLEIRRAADLPTAASSERDPGLPRARVAAERASVAAIRGRV